MTPGQIALVEETLAAVDIDELADDFYRRAFAADPTVSSMFTADPALQRARFGAELSEIVRSIRSLDVFDARVRTLGARHHSYGVRSAHYRLMGEALLAALAAALGDRWTGDVAEAWALAYNLTAETMMSGGLEGRRPR
jgi:hemoglobin-like flavoprotein